MRDPTPEPKRISMVTYRNRRKTAIASIENDNVKRIAQRLDSIKDNIFSIVILY